VIEADPAALFCVTVFKNQVVLGTVNARPQGFPPLFLLSTQLNRAKVRFRSELPSVRAKLSFDVNARSHPG
jgi:hypothetical protein